MAQRVTQQPTDNASLSPMVEQVKLQCGSPPEQVLADSGYFSIKNLEWLEQQKINACIPDSNMAKAFGIWGRDAREGHERRRTSACVKSYEVPQHGKPMPSARPLSNPASEC